MLNDEYVPTEVKLPASAFVVAVSCGSQHSSFLCNSGKAYICGNGKKGQLGMKKCQILAQPTLMTFNGMIKQICCGVMHTLILDGKKLRRKWKGVWMWRK